MKVPVQIEEFRMEVDMGAVASILNYTDYERYFKYLAVRPIEISFHAYTGALLDIAGQIVCAEQWLQCVFMLVIFLSYLRRFLCQHLSPLQSFWLESCDFKSSPEQFLSLEAKAVCIAACVLMD